MDGKVVLLLAVAGYGTGKWFSYSNKVVDTVKRRFTSLYLGTEEQVNGISMLGLYCRGGGTAGFP